MVISGDDFVSDANRGHEIFVFKFLVCRTLLNGVPFLFFEKKTGTPQ
jgi:hypothetical protein